MRIEYIGLKAEKRDNVAGTQTVWLGTGDVQDVPDEAAAVLLKHPDIWRVAVETKTCDDGTVAAGPAPLPDESPADPLAGMDDAALKAYAAERGLKVDGRKKGAALLQAVRDALA